MSYQILPNIIFILSVFGLLLIILRHLPETASIKDEQPLHRIAAEKLIAKGLPAQAISVARVTAVTVTKKVWNFVLEAKDLKPHAAAGYKMKKIFGSKLPLFGRPNTQLLPTTLHEVKNEQYYLDMIRLEPKVLPHYDALGKFYLEKENVNDAKDLYQYLVNHQPSHPDYQARLGFCFYQLKDFAKAAEHYQKSLALDSTQPNRYYNLGLSLDASGKKQEAIRALQKALELEPQNFKFLQTLEKMKGK